MHRLSPAQRAFAILVVVISFISLFLFFIVFAFHTTISPQGSLLLSFAFGLIVLAVPLGIAVVASINASERVAATRNRLRKLADDTINAKYRWYHRLAEKEQNPSIKSTESELAFTSYEDCKRLLTQACTTSPIVMAGGCTASDVVTLVDRAADTAFNANLLALDGSPAADYAAHVARTAYTEAMSAVEY